MSDPLFLVAVLALNVAVSEWLARHTVLRHIGTALLVIVVTSIVANAGLIPTYSDDVPVYRGIFAILAPVAIFWLLLGVHLESILQAGTSALVLFGLGALGTFAGVFAGMSVVGGETAFGELSFALGGMFVGTYVGGSVNYNAIALEYGVVNEGALYAGAAAVDSLMTTLWMALSIVLPRLLRRWLRRAGPVSAETMHGTPRAADERPSAKEAPLDGVEDDTEAIHPVDVAWLGALGFGAFFASNALSATIEERLGWSLPSILILTTIALACAQLPLVQRLRGARTLGLFTVYLFLAVIGALCDIGALRSIGSLGVDLFAFVCIVLGVHGVLVFGGAALLRLDFDVAAVASQANVGGGTSALALARSLGRADLVLPALLLGSLGSALGTYLGFLAAGWLT